MIKSINALYNTRFNYSGFKNTLTSYSWEISWLKKIAFGANELCEIKLTKIGYMSAVKNFFSPWLFFATNIIVFSEGLDYYSCFLLRSIKNSLLWDFCKKITCNMSFPKIEQMAQYLCISPLFLVYFFWHYTS